MIDSRGFGCASANPTGNGVLKMKFSTRSRVFVIAISLGAVLLGFTAYAAVIEILAVGTIEHSELFDGPAPVTVGKLTIRHGVDGQPGKTLPWHYHPGYAFNVVQNRNTDRGGWMWRGGNAHSGPGFRGAGWSCPQSEESQ